MRRADGTMSMPRGRRAFTLVELLIVISIIALLAAVTAGAAYRLKQSQDKSFTETTLAKLASALDAHWKVTIDAARREYDALPVPIRQNLIALADNQGANMPQPHPRRDDRARLIYVKLRLKQEFPVAFAMAKSPDPTAGYLPPTKVPGVPGQWTGKPAYVKAVSSGSIPSVDKQSSALLVMALEQARAGVTATPVDQLVGSQFLRTENGFRYLVDAWGEPLQFYAFPAYPVTIDGSSGPSTTDLDILRRDASAGWAKFADEEKDPQDPQQLLILDPRPTAARWVASAAFEALVYPQVKPNAAWGAGRPFNRKMVPVIVSAGPDGFLSKVSPVGVAADCAANNPYMALPDPAGSLDNLYSYRLRQGSTRGD